MLYEMLTAKRPIMANDADVTPVGTKVDNKLNRPLNAIVANANHRLPQRSKTSVKNVSAGNSVAQAMVNVRKKSEPRAPTFRT